MSVVAALHLVITAPRPAKRKDMDTQAGREVREEESIPELEEDDAVVKQVAGEFSAPWSGARSQRSSARWQQQQLSNQPTKWCPTTSRSGEDEVLESNFRELLELHLFPASQYALGRLEN